MRDAGLRRLPFEPQSPRIGGCRPRGPRFVQTYRRRLEHDAFRREIREERRADLAAQRKTLFDREARPIAAERARTFAAAYAGLLGPDARLHRDGMAPIAGRAAIARHVVAAAARIAWSPIDVRVAGSADMAVSYGSFRESDHGGQVRDGYYAHLWLRDTGGRWRLAYDIALASS